MSVQLQTNQLSLKQRLIQKYEQRNIPFAITLELTNRCNLRCSYCYIVRDEGQELSTDEWKSVLDELADLGCFEVILTGGEPLMRRDFFDIARRVRQQHFDLILFTNATLITEDVADRIKDLCPSIVEVSVYGTAATDEHITQVKGSFTRSIQGIKRLRSRDIQTTIKVSWVKEIGQNFDFFMNLANNLGVAFRGNILINYRRDGSPEPQNHRLDDDQLYRLLRALNEREIAELDEDARAKLMAGIQKREPYVPAPCGAGRMGLCISATGDVYPCVGLNLLKLGNIRETNIADIWRGSDALRELRSIAAADFRDCLTCDVSHYCVLCPGDNLLQGREMTECNPESKRIATIMKHADFDSLRLFGSCPR